MYFGLWRRDNIEEHLMQISEQQKKALWCQINFHKTVIGAKGSKTLFQKSTKGTSFSNEELQNNLIEILINETEPEVSPYTGLQLKEKDQWEDDITLRKESMSKVLGEAREKMQNTQHRLFYPHSLKIKLNWSTRKYVINV